jgi:hypothetical protein
MVVLIVLFSMASLLLLFATIMAVVNIFKTGTITYDNKCSPISENSSVKNDSENGNIGISPQVPTIQQEYRTTETSLMRKPNIESENFIESIYPNVVPYYDDRGLPSPYEED